LHPERLLHPKRQLHPKRLLHPERLLHPKCLPRPATPQYQERHQRRLAVPPPCSNRRRCFATGSRAPGHRPWRAQSTSWHRPAPLLAPMRCLAPAPRTAARDPAAAMRWPPRHQQEARRCPKPRPAPGPRRDSRRPPRRCELGTSRTPRHVH
jgi:hypothetical protein